MKLIKESLGKVFKTDINSQMNRMKDDLFTLVWDTNTKRDLVFKNKEYFKQPTVFLELSNYFSRDFLKALIARSQTSDACFLFLVLMLSQKEVINMFKSKGIPFIASQKQADETIYLQSILHRDCFVLIENTVKEKDSSEDDSEDDSSGDSSKEVIVKGEYNSLDKSVLAELKNLKEIHPSFSGEETQVTKFSYNRTYLYALYCRINWDKMPIKKSPTDNYLDDRDSDEDNKNEVVFFRNQYLFSMSLIFRFLEEFPAYNLTNLVDPHKPQPFVLQQVGTNLKKQGEIDEFNAEIEVEKLHQELSVYWSSKCEVEKDNNLINFKYNIRACEWGSFIKYLFCVLSDIVSARTDFGINDSDVLTFRIHEYHGYIPVGGLIMLLNEEINFDEACAKFRSWLTIVNDTYYSDISENSSMDQSISKGDLIIGVKISINPTEYRSYIELLPDWINKLDKYILYPSRGDYLSILKNINNLVNVELNRGNPVELQSWDFGSRCLGNICTTNLTKIEKVLILDSYGLIKMKDKITETFEYVPDLDLDILMYSLGYLFKMSKDGLNLDYYRKAYRTSSVNIGYSVSFYPLERISEKVGEIIVKKKNIKILAVDSEPFTTLIYYTPGNFGYTRKLDASLNEHSFNIIEDPRFWVELR